jgi:hypothetical protein
MRKFGITKAALGITAHGLRREYANDRYEDFAGVASPVRGGSAIARADDRAVRLRLAEELGHSREKSQRYVGAVLRRPRAIDPAKHAATESRQPVAGGGTIDDRRED